MQLQFGLLSTSSIAPRFLAALRASDAGSAVALSSRSLEKAREILMDTLSNYVAYTKNDVTLVFDAYLVKEGEGSDFMHDGYRVVYTKENQTADAYMEAFVAQIGTNYNVRVASSDALVQLGSIRSGVLRVSTRELLEEVVAAEKEMRKHYQA